MYLILFSNNDRRNNYMDYMTVCFNQIKKYVAELDTPEARSVFLIGLINKLYNYHPHSKEGGFISEEWLDKLSENINAMSYFCAGKFVSENEKRQLELLLEKKKRLQKENDILKSKLLQEKQETQQLINENTAIKENLAMYQAVKDIAELFESGNVKVLAERLNECSSFVEFANEDKKNVRELFRYASENIAKLEVLINDYVRVKEDDLESLQKYNER